MPGTDNKDKDKGSLKGSPTGSPAKPKPKGVGQSAIKPKSGVEFFQELAAAKAAGKSASAHGPLPGASRDAVSRFGALGKGVGASRDAVSRFGAKGKDGGTAAARREDELGEAEDTYSGSGKMRGKSYKKSDLGSTAADGLQGLLEKGQTVEEVFQSLDIDNSGFLDREELVSGMSSLGTGCVLIDSENNQSE